MVNADPLARMRIAGAEPVLVIGRWSDAAGELGSVEPLVWVGEVFSRHGLASGGSALDQSAISAMTSHEPSVMTRTMSPWVRTTS